MGAGKSLSIGSDTGLAPFPSATLLVILLDHVEASIVILIVQDNEQLTQEPTVVFPDHHEDASQLLIGEVSWQS